MDSAYKLQKAGSLQQAELLYQKVLAAEPGNPFAVYALGIIALNRGDAGAAAPLLRQALATGYTDETVCTHLGIALQMLGRAEEAMEVYQAAIKRDPKNPRYPSNVAVVLAMRGDHKAALRESQRAIRLDGSFVPAYVNGAASLQALGCLEEAAAMFEKVLQLDPSHEAAKAALKSIRQSLMAENHVSTAPLPKLI